MSDFWRQVDVRTVVTLVIIDQITYATVYWFAVPALNTVILALPAVTQYAVMLVIEAVRLTLVGFFAARSLRARRGFDSRSDALASVAVGAAVATVVQLGLGLLAGAVTGTPLEAGSTLVSIVMWLAFPLLGLLFVTPGAADVFSRRRGVPVR